MGVYIPNMEKPKECIECEFSCLWANGSTHCMVDGEELFCDGIPQRHDCPLIDIVRCGECKWYNPWHANHTNIDGNHCRKNNRPMKPTDFCSYGERRSE